MSKRRRLIWLLAGSLAAAPLLTGIESSVRTGGVSMAFTAPALADDDDDDDDDRPSRRYRGGDDDDDRPRARFRYDDDDDDDDDVVARPRRQAPRPQRVAARPELVASGVSDEALARLRAAGFSVLAERRLSLLPLATVRLRPPARLTNARARSRLAELAPGALIDQNVFYRPNARRACTSADCFPYLETGWTVAACPARGTVGMIDTRVDAAHPALSGRSVEILSTRGDGRAASSPLHGTEVAILLAGERGPTDDLKLLAVDAFHRSGRNDQTDVFDLVAAIDLLVARGAKVVNLSLAGPPNEVLDRAGETAKARGAILVAAVGNEGPKAKPRYPAAYPWAVGVTAIDARGEPYRRAGRGPHVAFAAPGVRIELPNAAMKPATERSGTSYAAPLVSAALSSLLASAGEPDRAVASLAEAVEDAGAPGRDPVFGWGALAPGKGCPSARGAQAQ